MQSITLNILRNGNLTSSEIVALTTNNKSKQPFGTTGHTYITECNMERRLGRSITDEVNARAFSWGHLCEKYVLENRLGLEYRPCSAETIQHPEINYWCGSPDAEKFDDGKTVCDVKSPIILKSFCTFVDAGNIYEIRENHKDGEKYFWQLVSNGILTKSKFAELIIFAPYKSELQALRDLALASDDKAYSWIFHAKDEELPHLIDGGYYKNLNIIRFDIPETDKAFLTERVLLAGESLIEFK